MTNPPDVAKTARISESLAPISKLNEDLLWSVFKINTEMPPTESDFPLTTTRHTSQVCRSWRELILRSSSLWGRLIDLDLLDQKNENWRREVVRRSGTSFLWIRGSITSFEMCSFIFSLLNKDWERIQKLDIHDLIRANLIDEANQAWHASCTRPAPNLEVFKVSSRLATHFVSTSSSPIFEDFAPTLREFKAPDLPFTPRAPWLSNIRSMTFSPPFAVPEIFEALKVMPLLEYLDIRRAPWVRTENIIFPDVHLPRLEDLRLRGQLNHCFPFLDKLIPAPTCSLSLVVKSHTDIPETNLSEAAHQQIARYMQIDENNNVKKNLFIRYFGRNLVLNQGAGMDASHFSSSSFSTGIYGYPNLSDLILKETSYFFNVKEINLDFTNTQVSSNIIPALSALQSLETLETTDGTLQFLLDREEETSQFFPALRIIKLASLRPPPHHSDTYPSESLLPFLTKRRDSGRPILVFDLTNFSFDFLYDMEFLDALTGLKVMWKHPRKGIMEYECGSSGPENLRFRSFWLPNTSA